VVKSEEARTSEARRAEAESGVLGKGAASPPPHQLGVWGSAVSSPSGVRGNYVNLCLSRMTADVYDKHTKSGQRYMANAASKPLSLAVGDAAL